MLASKKEVTVSRAQSHHRYHKLAFVAPATYWRKVMLVYVDNDGNYYHEGDCQMKTVEDHEGITLTPVEATDSMIEATCEACGEQLVDAEELEQEQDHFAAENVIEPPQEG
jgi:hypothetical protein